MWIGLVWENEWRWTDDTPIWTNWNSGEPNGNFKEPCGMTLTAAGKWNDWLCDNKAGYICRKDYTYT
jgi:hypothetical protein